MNRPMLKYIAALLLFGSNGIVASLISLDSSEIVMYRTLIGSALLIALYLLSGGRFTFYRQGRSFAFLALSGISMGVSWLFLYEAYRRVGVSVASLGYYCGPVIVMAVSPLLFRERLTKRKLLCFFVVLAGIVLVNSGALHEARSLAGMACALASAVMYACMVCFNKKARGITGMENAALQLSLAFLTVFVYVLLWQGVGVHIPAGDIAPLLFLGLVNTGVGCFLYFSSIGAIPVQSVAILGYLEPLSAILFSVLFLRESMTPMQAAGAALIILGAIGAERRGKAPRGQA